MGIGAAVAGGLATAYAADKQADASEAAADTQAQATMAGVREQRRQFNRTREDLAPYRQAGADALPGLQNLVTDPSSQRQFIQDNPFYKTLADDAQSRVFETQAARGKLGSGDTASALQDNLLKLGSDLLNQNIAQRSNLVSMGQSASAQTGQFGQQTANTISDLHTQRGNAQAAGTVGAANAWTNAANNAMNTGANLYALNTMYGSG